MKKFLNSLASYIRSFERTIGTYAENVINTLGNQNRVMYNDYLQNYWYDPMEFDDHIYPIAGRDNSFQALTIETLLKDNKLFVKDGCKNKTWLEIEPEHPLYKIILSATVPCDDPEEGERKSNLFTKEYLHYYYEDTLGKYIHNCVINTERTTSVDYPHPTNKPPTIH